MVEMSIHFYLMKSNFLILILFISASFKSYSQNFEGRMSYSNYNVTEDDTVVSSIMNYWIKDHLYKHTGSVEKMPLYDLGTLYANADKMSRTNIANSTVERIKMSLNPIVPDLSIKPTDQTETILGFDCAVWELKNAKTNKLISRLWITDEIVNANFDQFVELFEHNNTLFPLQGIKGWILKREDYRREGKIFVSEAKEVKSMELNIAEMTVY